MIFLKPSKKQNIFGASHGGPGRRIFSREALLLRGGRKGDPDTKSGLGKTTNNFSCAIFSLLSARSAEKIFRLAPILVGKSLCSKN